jgi:aspartate 1-decarboxylase
VRTNSLTRFEDQSSAQVQRFSLANLNVGDFVEIRAYNDGSGLVATVLEREDAQSRIEVQGRAAGLVQPDFTVAGVAVTTDASTEFRDKNGVTITASAFFAAASGHTVKVRGTLVGNVVLAERAELED